MIVKSKAVITRWNGLLNSADLVAVRGILLSYGPADAIKRAFAAGAPGKITEGYRDYATQVRYYKNPPNSVGLAAKPGTSVHGEGLAIDVTPDLAAYLDAHLEYGFRRTVKVETWHYEWNKSWETLPPITQKEVENIMASGAQLSDVIGLLRCKTGAVVAVVKGTGQVRGVEFGAYQTLANAGLLPGLFFDDGAGADLSDMDEGPFGAVVKLLGG